MNDDKPTPMQRIAYDIISEIIDKKRGNTEPCMAYISEIRNSVNIGLLQALRELCNKGILSYNIDIAKNPMFTIKQPL